MIRKRSSSSLIGADYSRVLKVSTAPTDFLEIYNAEEYRNADPAGLNARFGRGANFFGDRASPYFRGRETEFLFNEMHRFGVRSGLGLAIDLPGDAVRGCLTFTTDRPSQVFRREIEPLIPALVPVGRFLFSRWRAHIALPDKPSLSQREIECLSLLAAGYRADRISEILAISRPTVDFHFKSATRKLKSTTREQALARAVALGLVVP
jgi:DNA-binding CsgD family transcriptional regulator